jgi:two-component system sensor histidine kinase CpxA
MNPADFGKIRVPLFAKIIGWSLLNLAAVTLLLGILFRGEFSFFLDSVASGRAGERVQSVADVLSAELREQPPHQWTPALTRFSEAYQTTFLAVTLDGERLAGPELAVPEPVKRRLRSLPPRPHPPGLVPHSDGGRPGRPEDRSRNEEERDDRRRRERPGEARRDYKPQRFMMRAGEPPKYWVAAPLQAGPQPGPPIFLLAASDSLEGGGLFFDFKPWLIFAGGVLAVSGLFWLPFVRGVTRSVGRMTAATTEISKGRFSGRLEETRRDELGQLAVAINQMSGQLSNYVHGQKRFLGDIAHELCAPIARMQMAIGILLERAEGPSREYVESLEEEIREMSQLVNELLSFSKASLGGTVVVLRPTNLRECVETVLRRENNLELFDLSVPPDIQVDAEPELIKRAVGNVVRNAVRYAASSGKISIRAIRNGPRTIELSIADQGPGVPPDALEKLFEPFYRVDAARTRETGGVGLGLAIVRTCLQACGGVVTCRNRTPHGLEIVMQFRESPPGELRRGP